MPREGAKFCVRNSPPPSNGVSIKNTIGRTHGLLSFCCDVALHSGGALHPTLPVPLTRGGPDTKGETTTAKPPLECTGSTVLAPPSLRVDGYTAAAEAKDITSAALAGHLLEQWRHDAAEDLDISLADCDHNQPSTNQSGGVHYKA
jgi:hypothetical protein